MTKRKQLVLMTLSAFGCLLSVQAIAADSSGSNVSDVDKDVVTRKHYDFPFVHVEVGRRKDGTKDVDVRAPFTKVHNPAGGDNAQVKAPFYKSAPAKSDTANNAKTKQANQQKLADKRQQQKTN
jgi:hypothetical protein